MKSIENLLEQLLRNGTGLSQNPTQAMSSAPVSPSPNSADSQYANHLSGAVTSGISSVLSGKGGAALAGGALGLLLGSKSGRKMGGKVMTYGGLAALGALAFKAYQNYQQNSVRPTIEPKTPLPHLPPQAAEARCKAILIALIAASKADGHIDDRERRMIDIEVSKLTADPDIQRWIATELKRPLDPSEVAKHATNQTMASEMYLVSLLAVDEQNFMERSYIQELATQLKLPPELQKELALQAKGAMA
jgi:uncharacterized membrane protein YebE (DUF533 family)